MTTTARRLRRSETPAERWLWGLLRDRRLSGLKFRRQFGVGPFVADFCCYELRLIIELDGAVHQDEQGIARDRERDAFLTGQGYTVLRFDNSSILGSPDTAFEKILAIARKKGWTPR